MIVRNYGKLFILLLIIQGLSFSAFCIEYNNKNIFIIKTKKIFNSLTGDYDLNKYILIENGIIKSISSNLLINDKSKTSVLDLSTLTVLPGLIDAHTHLLFSDRSLDENFQHELAMPYNLNNDKRRLELALDRGKSLLKSGITTVRDLGNSGKYLDIKLKNYIYKEKRLGPNVIASGPGIVFGNGQFEKNISIKIVDLEYDSVKNKNSVKKIVLEHAKKGVDVIKVYADNEPGKGGFSLDLLKTIVDVAHSLNIKVTAHAVYDHSALIAIKAGVDSIEHGYELKNKTLRLMKQKGTVLIPTDQSETNYKMAMKIFDKKGNVYLDFKERVREKRSRLKRAIKEGVKIVYGSDFIWSLENDRSLFGPLSINVLLDFKKSGMSPKDILRCATFESAKLLNMEKYIGSIKEGAYADVIAVKGDPLKKIDTIKNIQFVMKKGKILFWKGQKIDHLRIE